jgi:flagellar biosynthetic protein FliQ
MTPEYVIKLSHDTILVVLFVAGPSLLVALVVGLAVSIVQAVTQIHEMTLTFIPKILAVAVVLVVMLPWTLRKMVDFTVGLISSIPTQNDGIDQSTKVPAVAVRSSQVSCRAARSTPRGTPIR